MTRSALSSEIADRMRVFRALVRAFNKVHPAAFFQRTGEYLPEIRQIHPLIQGIFKPKDAVLPLSIASMLKSQYNDQLYHEPDGSWWMHYSPKAGSMTAAENAGLIQCMTEKQPVLVLHQESAKTGSGGARHRLLGLGAIESFDPSAHLFRVRGLRWDEIEAYLGSLEDQLEAAVRLKVLEEWQPFEAENKAASLVTRQKRTQAFMNVVLESYDYACAVTGQRFRSARHVEADAAHIIGKKYLGTDDPRNGVALSQSAHWAFDRGLFTISDQYEVVVNPKARAVSSVKFPVLEMHGRKIALPTDQKYRPHIAALAWHKTEVFDRFQP